MRRFKYVIVASVLSILPITTSGVSINAFAEPGQTLFINEVMAGNSTTLRDGDVDDPKNGAKGGSYSDWVEIYNSSPNEIDLTGYTISDDGATWTCPQGKVPAGGYLIIWASDKDKVAKDGQLHTNFKISSSGETITLKRPDGSIVDTVTTVNLADDETYGRKTDGSAQFVVFSKATPGSANIYDQASVAVKMPSFSHKGGFYTSAFDLQITTDEAGVKIYYTTDGSDPVPNAEGSKEYMGNINIKSRAGDPNVLSMIKNISADTTQPWKAPVGEVFKCTTIRAVAVRDDGTKSKIVTHSYFVDPDMKTRYSIPVISLVTDKTNLFDSATGIYTDTNCEKGGSEWERPMHIEFFEPDGTLGFSQYIGARIHGGWTRKYPQKSFRIYADAGYDDIDKIKYEIFPGLKKRVSGKKLDSFERLILRNAGNDWTGVMFRDEMMQSLVSHLKLDTQAYRPSVVFLDGEYWGIYNIRERYDDEYLKSHYNLDKDKVAILDVLETPEVQDGKEEDAVAYTSDIIDYLKQNPITENSTYEYIKTKMDVENYIDYNVAEIFFGNTDWPGNNVAIWKYKTDDGQYHPEAPYGQDGRWRWLLKDVDFGFGLYGSNVNQNTLAFAVGDTQIFGSQANPPWAVFLLKTLLQNSEFRNEFINRFADQMNTSFEPARVNQRIDEVKSGIEAAMPEHSDRWQAIKMTANNGMENPWGQTATWAQAVQQMKNYASNRPSNVRKHIISKFSANGVTGTAEVKLNSDLSKGYIRINSIDINSSTPGVTNPDSWTGTYFKGVPITVKAIPEEGYKFDHWEGVTGVSETSDTITLDLTSDVNLTAVYKLSGSVDPILYGDLSRDGKVNSSDLLLLKKYILGLIGPEEVDMEAADLNKDGKVNSIDLLNLKRKILE